MFQFSIRAAFKDSWKLFVQHWLFFGVLALIMVVLNGFDHTHTHSPWLLALVTIAAIIWGYVSISASLAAVDGKGETLDLNNVVVHMPTFRQFFMLLAIDLVAGLIVGVGIILLIIPGIYFLVRLSLISFAYVDRDAGIKNTLRFSWHLVKGKIFWTVLLVLLIEVVLIVVGELFFGIGSLVTYPLAILLVAHLYRALTKHQQAVDATPATPDTLVQ